MKSLVNNMMFDAVQSCESAQLIGRSAAPSLPDSKDRFASNNNKKTKKKTTWGF